MMKDGVSNRNGLEMKTRLIMDVVEMEMDEEPIEDEEEEEEIEICTLVALNLDTGVEVSLHTSREIHLNYVQHVLHIYHEGEPRVCQPFEDWSSCRAKEDWRH